ncbi:MAG: thioesterase [Gammaproteobacteria bacterium]|nr:thioesterase [Gammaproteobacteria bacterium]
MEPQHSLKLYAGWGDMDWNSHMANTAYLNKVVDARVTMLAERGFPLTEFVRLRLGVVIMKDELEYRREVKWMDEINITFLVAGLASDGSRFKVKNEIFRSDGELCAKVTSIGGFMNLDARKLVAPPESILEAYRSLPRTEDYVELPSSIKTKD